MSDKTTPKTCENCTFLLCDSMKCVHGNRRNKPNSINFPSVDRNDLCEYHSLIKSEQDRAYQTTTEAINAIRFTYNSKVTYE